MTRQIPKQTGFGIVTVVLLMLVVAALLVAGTVLYQCNQPNISTTNSSATGTTTVVKADPYAGWMTYTSAVEKLSFRYPSDWQATPSVDKVGGEAALKLHSPSGSVVISWFPTILGAGGACDDTIMPGTAIGSSAIGACPYWEVLDKQKLAGADLYYVAGVETADGKTYAPWCALQAPGGLLSSRSSIGYLLFTGKNNDYTDNGRDYGPQQVGLVCGKSFGAFGVQGLSTGTKAQATALLPTPEFQQAKLILLSTSY